MTKYGFSNLGKIFDAFSNLKYITHVKDNREGLVAHTTVSSGYNVPLCLSFESTGNSSSIFFERLLNSYFEVIPEKYLT